MFCFDLDGVRSMHIYTNVLDYTQKSNLCIYAYFLIFHDRGVASLYHSVPTLFGSFFFFFFFWFFGGFFGSKPSNAVTSAFSYQ